MAEWSGISMAGREGKNQLGVRMGLSGARGSFGRHVAGVQREGGRLDRVRIASLSSSDSWYHLLRRLPGFVGIALSAWVPSVRYGGLRTG